MEAKKAKKPLLVKIYAVWVWPLQANGQANCLRILQMLGLADQLWHQGGWGYEYGKEFNKKNQVSKYPTTLFFNAEGKEVYRLTGFRNLKGFMALMDSFLKGTLRPEEARPLSPHSRWRTERVFIMQ